MNDRLQVDDAVFANRLWESTGLKEALTENEDVQNLWYVVVTQNEKKLVNLFHVRTGRGWHADMLNPFSFTGADSPLA